MTAPVITKVEPEDKQMMCFYLGADHQESAPVPTNPQVTLETLPEMTVYVRYALQSP